MTRHVVLLSVSVALAVVGLGLIRGGGPDWFVHLGQQSKALGLARDVLGPDVAVPLQDRHDGETFWVLARDPLLRQGPSTGSEFDQPAYRAQRIAYPWLAAPWRLGGEWPLLWGLIATNVLAVAAGAYATAELARDSGSSWWTGMAFVLNPLVLVAVLFDLCDAVALAALVAAMLFLGRGRGRAAVLMACLAALAKETSLVPVVFVALVTTSVDRRARWRFAVLPVLVVAAWGLYERWRLRWPQSVFDAFTAVPFKGFLDAYRLDWSAVGDWGNAMLAVLLIPVAVVVVLRWWSTRSLLMTAALPFALMVPFLSALVVDLPQNAVRAIGPALTFLVIDVYRPTPDHAPQPASTSSVEAS